MPFEQINFPMPFTTPECGCDRIKQHCSDCPPPVHGLAWPEPTVSVQWSRIGSGDMRGGVVQMSMLLPEGYLRLLNQTLEDPDVANAAAFSPALTREELNRLIRVLRRARDTAFGKDE